MSYSSVNMTQYIYIQTYWYMSWKLTGPMANVYRKLWLEAHHVPLQPFPALWSCNTRGKQDSPFLVDSFPANHLPKETAAQKAVGACNIPNDVYGLPSGVQTSRLDLVLFSSLPIYYGIYNSNLQGQCSNNPNDKYI